MLFICLLQLSMMLPFGMCWIANNAAFATLSHTSKLRTIYGITTAAIVILIAACFGLFNMDSNENVQELVRSSHAIASSTIAPIEAKLYETSVVHAVKDYDFLIFLKLLVLAGMVLSAFRGCRSYLRLASFTKSCFCLRRIGAITILATDSIDVPFAFRTLRTKIIVLPTWILADYRSLRMAISHEFQHHRQTDTTWTHILNVAQPLFFANPFYYFFRRELALLQELACDEILIGRKGYSPKEYGCCLVQVASHSSPSSLIRLGAINAMASLSSKTLTRRINEMNKPTLSKVRNWQWTLTLALSLFCFTVAASAANTLYRSAPMNLDDANAFLSSIESDSSFPYEVNPKILRWLNYYSTNPKGQASLRAGISRMNDYKKMVGTKIESMQLPPELLAVGIVESGYSNFPPSKNSIGAAGLWQIMPETGRNYGLIVDSNSDQRMEPELATDAALRLLSALNMRFNDWRLAILAYNSGAYKVQKGIDQMKSRDPWALIENGYRGDRSYLAKVMATALLINQEIK